MARERTPIDSGVADAVGFNPSYIGYGSRTGYKEVIGKDLYKVSILVILDMAREHGHCNEFQNDDQVSILVILDMARERSLSSSSPSSSEEVSILVILDMAREHPLLAQLKQLL